jgi:hypothetical protein
MFMFRESWHRCAASMLRSPLPRMISQKPERVFLDSAPISGLIM